MEHKLGKKNRKYGRNEGKCKRYALEHRREKHKIKRVLLSNGEISAAEYADKHNLGGYLRSLVAS